MLPVINAFNSVPHVSASQAERLLACPLRFVLDQDPALRRMQPCSAAAIVGTAAHAALAALIRAFGGAPRAEAAGHTRALARQAFDAALALECRRRDRLIAARGELPGDCMEAPSAVPFYGMTRARFSRFAEERFGAEWLWPEPSVGERPTGTAAREARDPVRELEPEFRIASADGSMVGIADVIERSGGGVVIEELKSGEVTPERLASWRLQLQINAHLYFERFGRAPDLLRVISLSDGTREFAYESTEGAKVAAQLRDALAAVNARIGSGATAAELARPSAPECCSCPHRPWCEPYWETAGESDADTEGTVIATDGWIATLQTARGTVRVDLKASAVTLSTGSHVRLCGARRDQNGTLRCGRTTSVWRVGA
jgi:hypothetical protein